MGSFQFTHPVRGATNAWGYVDEAFDVSIHAPREGCDSEAQAADRERLSFNSRTP